MSTLRELKRQREKLAGEMTEMVKVGLKNKPDEARFDEILDESRRIAGQIEVLEESAPGQVPLPANGGFGRPGGPIGDGRSNDVAQVTTGPEFRSMFPNLSRDEGGEFRDFDDLVRVIASGRHDPRLEERAASGAVPGDGGFALDVQYENFLLDESLSLEVFRNIPGLNIYPMSSRTLRVPAFDTTDLSAGGVGGMVGYWTKEGGSITETTPAFRRIELSAKKLAILSRASLELNEDGINFGAEVARGLAGTMGRYLDAAFINGDGSGKPLGVLNSAGKIAVAAEGGQAGSSIVLENVSKMYARMNPAAQRRAVWLASPDIIPQLYGLTIDVGTGGSWVQPMKEESGQFYLMGRPVYFSGHCSVLGTEGDIMFFDPASYAIGIIGGSMRLSYSDHRYFESHERLWKSTIRVDGQCTAGAATTPENSGDTWSPVVTLASRP